MSTTIDERVVSMEFDNKRFENNVRTSLGTLDKLKQSLNFTGATKGLEDIDSVSKKINFSALGNAVETVGLKFNAMYTIADQAFRNITNSAMIAGKRVASAFTIEPIKTGFSEYETQINAVQTILANTESKGTTLDDVSMALDELNKYADKTIYNFTEMTRNIGTFTAAGVDLDTSVNAIQGIANLAAISGSNAQQASTAMYQLSQALASGTVKLMDWNSVVNAGMGGQVFQDALKETARAHGIAIDDMIKKNGSFRETLQEGWLTSDILTETLQKFTLTTEGLTEAQIEQNRAMLKSKGYTDEQIDEIFKLGETATNAATKVKTFTQLMDTLKEAAQSGWTQTWELIVGDFEEAKELWTKVSDIFGGFINSSAEARNSLLEGALVSNWDKMTGKLEEAGVTTEKFEQVLTNTLEDNGYDVAKLIETYGSLEKVFQSGAVSADLLHKAIAGITKAVGDFNLDNVDRTLKNGMRGDDVKEVEKALKALGYNLTGKDGKDYSDDGYYGTLTAEAVKEFQKANGLKVTGIIDEETLAALREATSTTAELNDSIFGLIDGVTQLGGRELIIESFMNVLEGVKNIIAPITEAFREIFPPATSEQLYDIIKGFHDLTRNFKLWTYTARGKETLESLKNTFKGIFSVIDIGWTLIKKLVGGIFDLIKNFSSLGSGILNVTGSIGEWLTGLKDTIKETDIFGNVVNAITSFITGVVNAIKTAASYIGEKFSTPGFDGLLGVLGGIWEFMKLIGGKIVSIGSKVTEAFSGLFATDNITNGIDILNGGLFAGLLMSMTKFFKGLAKSAEDGGGIFNSLKEMIGGIGETLETVRSSLEAWQQNLKAGTLLKIAGAIGILALSILVIASIEPDKLASSLGTITVLFAELMASLAVFSAISGDITGATKGVTAMIGIATAVLILSAALKTISDLSWDQLAVGLAGIAGLTAIVVIAAKNLASESKAIIKGAVQMAIFALAIKVLASACKDLSQLSWEELAKGLIGVGALMAAVAIFLNNAKFSGKSISTATGMVILAAAMKVFASACSDFGQMSTEEIIEGLGAIGAVLLSLAIFTKMTGNAKNALSIGASLILIAASMKIFASAMTDIASLSYEQLFVGLAGIAGALLAVAMAMKVLPEKGMLGTGIGLAVVAASMLILAEAVNKMSSMTWDEIGRGLGVLAGSMIILAYSLKMMAGTLSGSAALLLAATSLAIMAPVLKLLGSLSWESIAKGLIALAGAFAIMGIAGTVLAPIIPAILGLAGAFALIGVGIFALGAGVAALATGLTTLAIAGASVLSLIPLIVRELGNAVIEFFKVIAGSADALGEAVTVIVLELIDVFVQCIPALVDGILKLVDELLKSLAQYTPSIIDSLMTFLIGLIDGIALRMPELIESLLNLLTSLFKGVADAFGGLDMSTLFTTALGVALLAGLMAVLGAIAPLIPGAMVGILGMGAIVAELAIVLAAIGALAQIPGLKWLIEEGGKLLEDIGIAIGRFFGGLISGGLRAILDSFNGYTQEDAERIKSTAGALAAIVDVANAVPDTSVFENLTGVSDLKNFASSLPGLAGSIKAFAVEASTISETEIEAMLGLVPAIEAYVDIANAVPESGLIEKIFGLSNLKLFSDGLTTLGPAVNSFVDSTSEITEDDLKMMTSIASAVTKYVEIANAVPEGGLIEKIFGISSLTLFSSGLSSLGPAINSFIGSTSEVTDDNLKMMTSIASAISKYVEIANAVPEEGVFSKIFGLSSFSLFSKGLEKLGGAVVSFTKSVSEVTISDILKMGVISSAVDKYVEIAKKIPEKSFWETITGTTELTTFAGELQTFGQKMGSFSTSVANVDIAKMDSSITSANKALQLSKDIKEAGSTDNLKNFGDNITWFSDGVETLALALAEVDTSKISSVITQVTRLIDMTKKAAAADSEGLKSFLNSFGDLSLDAFTKAFENSNIKIVGAVSKMMTYFKLAITAQRISVVKSLTDVVTHAVSAISTKYVGFYMAGKFLVTGFANGITANTYLAVAKAKLMALAALAAAKAVLQINSPSKAFMKIGESVPEGFAKGIDKLSGLVTGSTESMGKDAVVGTKKAISRLVDIVNSDMIDTQPTIRPILDLSDVESGVGTIDGLFGMQPSIGLMSNVGSISSMMSNRQNGDNSDVISAINELGRKIGNTSNTTYNVNGVTYDDGTNISNAVKSLVRAAKVERRI